MVFKLITLESRWVFLGDGEEWVLGWFFGEFLKLKHKDINNLGWKGRVGVIFSNLLLKADPTRKSGPKWICLHLLCILRLRGTQIFTASALLISQLTWRRSLGQWNTELSWGSVTEGEGSDRMADPIYFCSPGYHNLCLKSQGSLLQSCLRAVLDIFPTTSKVVTRSFHCFRDLFF